MIIPKEEVVGFIKSNLTPEKWVGHARDNNKLLKALVLGEKFNETLIKKIEKIESDDRAVARKKYSKDIRDLFFRVNQPRDSVFSASGGSVDADLPDGEKRQQFINSISEFKGQKSLKKYLSENFFNLSDVDPNGLIFVEYIEDEDIYPTYKSINDIRYYKSNGQLCEVLLFEPIETRLDNRVVHEWRLVDDLNDWRVLQDGEEFKIIEDKSFTHPFKQVPASILSDKKSTGSELRISYMFPIISLSEDYAAKKSVSTIYDYQSGIPSHWMYKKFCRTCHGVGKDGTKTCVTCKGTGNFRNKDVTDLTVIDMPRDKEDAILTEPEGWVSPDYEYLTLSWGNLKDKEDLIDSTMWGTRRIKDGGNETATGRFIDVQPVINKLDTYSDSVEWVHNHLAKLVMLWVYNGEDKYSYQQTYGRNFIIEGPNVILERYTKSRESGDNNTILDKLLSEYILAKYQSNPHLLHEAVKKASIEPYLHQSIEEVNTIFGSEEAEKKVLFVSFWIQANKDKEIEVLGKEFSAYFESNKMKSSTKTIEE